MQNITTTAELKNVIQILEVEQTIKGQELKEQFYLTYESLKTVNLIKSTLKEAVTSPLLIDNILGTVLGLATGYYSKKFLIGTSGNILRKLFGSIFQLGVTKVVVQPTNTIKSFGQFIYHHIFHKK
jgi:hypothetical protein